MSAGRPTLRVEKAMLRAGASRLGGVDEVGRGSPAGPATCAVVVIDQGVGRVPEGLRDSKLLSAAAREALVVAVERWALDWAVGHASAAEVDALGLTSALRLAGHRALAQLSGPIDAVLLDGSFDWLRRPEQSSLLTPEDISQVVVPPVTTKVKADLSCATVAAASVLAKVARDALMAELAEQYPGYGWESNKGYGSPEHLDAIRRLGLTPQHRKSWSLPGVSR
jgi:ribonuclease HII